MASTYRDVLRLPGVRALFVVGFLARLPATAAGVMLTLHVAVRLGQGFAAAGLVGGAITVGIALGAPLLGWVVDRVGLRVALALSAVADAAFWTVAPWLPVGTLAASAFVVGLLSLPAFSVTRQALAVAVATAEPNRRPAYALDAMSAEISFIVGPAIGTALVLTLPASVSLRLVGAGFVVMAGLLAWLDPPTHGTEDDGTRSGTARGRWAWVTRPMVAALAMSTAAVYLLGSTELGVVASLTARSETGFWAVANTLWCLASIVGGWIYGTRKDPPGARTLLAVLAVASVPVALGGPWWVATLVLVPAGAFCAPALAASAETVGRLAPESVRGVVTGLHGSAITVGQAIAAPVSGVLIDGVGPPAAILVAVAGALVVALAAAVLG